MELKPGLSFFWAKLIFCFVLGSIPYELSKPKPIVRYLGLKCVKPRPEYGYVKNVEEVVVGMYELIEHKTRMIRYRPRKASQEQTRTSQQESTRQVSETRSEKQGHKRKNQESSNTRGGQPYS